MSLSGAGNRVGSIKLLIGEKVRREKLWTSAGATPFALQSAPDSCSAGPAMKN
jgi:hypothetical protein